MRLASWRMLVEEVLVEEVLVEDVLVEEAVEIVMRYRFV